MPSVSESQYRNAIAERLRYLTTSDITGPILLFFILGSRVTVLYCSCQRRRNFNYLTSLQYCSRNAFAIDRWTNERTNERTEILDLFQVKVVFNWFLHFLLSFILEPKFDEAECFGPGLATDKLGFKSKYSSNVKATRAASLTAHFRMNHALACMPRHSPARLGR